MEKINQEKDKIAFESDSQPEAFKLLTPGNFFILKGKRYIKIDGSLLAGQVNSLDKNGKPVYIPEGENVQPGAFYYSQDRNLFYFRIDEAVSGNDKINAIHQNSGMPEEIDEEAEINIINEDWPKEF